MTLPQVVTYFEDMPRVDAIWGHPTYRAALDAIARAEEQRIYCKHGLSHALDVARLMWAALLEQGDAGRGIAREMVYATALLHDVGRAAQYETGEDHHLASSRIAREILGTVEKDRAFSAEHQRLICEAIAAHGDATRKAGLSALLYAADKASRTCFACAAQATCAWPEEKRNLTLRA